MRLLAWAILCHQKEIKNRNMVNDTKLKSKDENSAIKQF